MHIWVLLLAGKGYIVESRYWILKQLCKYAWLYINEVHNLRKNKTRKHVTSFDCAMRLLIITDSFVNTTKTFPKLFLPIELLGSQPTGLDTFVMADMWSFFETTWNYSFVSHQAALLAVALICVIVHTEKGREHVFPTNMLVSFLLIIQIHRDNKST